MPTSCIRGTKVQNLLGASTDAFVGLIGALRAVRRRRPARACYRWLGKTVSVLTDGGFERDGCPRLAHATRVASAARVRGP